MKNLRETLKTRDHQSMIAGAKELIYFRYVDETFAMFEDEFQLQLVLKATEFTASVPYFHPREGSLWQITVFGCACRKT